MASTFVHLTVNTTQESVPFVREKAKVLKKSKSRAYNFNKTTFNVERENFCFISVKLNLQKEISNIVLR